MVDVILLERVEKLGHLGQIVKVKPGYARNFLLPQKKALRATKDNLAYFETQRVVLEANNLRLKVEAEAVGAKMGDLSVIVIRQAGETGQLYGSVTARDLSEASTAAGFTVSRSQIVLNTPIKAIGVHKVAVHLHPEVEVFINANVARSPEEAERQARGEDVTVHRQDEDEFENPETVEIPGVPGTGEQPDV